MGIVIDFQPLIIVNSDTIVHFKWIVEVKMNELFKYYSFRMIVHTSEPNIKILIFKLEIGEGHKT